MDEDLITYSISWQGVATGPYSIKDLRSMLKAGKINSLYRIHIDGDWVMLRDFLSQIDRVTYIKESSIQSIGKTDDQNIDKDRSSQKNFNTEGASNLRQDQEIIANVKTYYHVNHQGRSLGSFTREQLLDMVKSGLLPLDAICLKEGHDDWQPIRNILNLVIPPIRNQTHESMKINIHDSESHPGFWLRFAALFIDIVFANIMIFLVVFLMIFTIALSDKYDDEVLEIIGQTFGLIAHWLYHALFESSKKQATPGKIACGIIVTDMDGNRISFGKATGRYFGKLVSGLLLCLGYLMCVFTDKKQCLHDIMAGCLLFKKR